MKIIKGGVVVSATGSRILDLAVDGTTIASIAPTIAPQPEDEVIDARGCLVFPGFIDAHTHFDLNTGSCVTADGFRSGTLAALAGGTTTIVDFATQDRGMTLGEALSAWHHKAVGVSSCDYAFHMAITDWNEYTRKELDHMIAQGVTSFKLYMAYDALRVADDVLLDIIREMKRIKGLVGVHCENGTLVNKLIADQLAQGHTDPAAHPLARPPEVEAEAVNRLLYLSRMADWPVCVVHLSTKLGLMEIKSARADGQQVVVETCPQYLMMTDDLYSLPDFCGAKYVCSPPLRKAEDVKALREAIQSGEVDTLATDHCSFNFHGQKDMGRDDFSKIPNGLPGVEHRAMAAYTELVHSGEIGPERLCALMSENPARLYGMYPRKGALLVGSDADIVVWAKGEDRIISQKTQRQNVDYTPLEGYVAKGYARDVLLRGEVCVRHGEVVQEMRGQYVHRGISAFG